MNYELSLPKVVDLYKFLIWNWELFVPDNFLDFKKFTNQILFWATEFNNTSKTGWSLQLDIYGRHSRGEENKINNCNLALINLVKFRKFQKNFKIFKFWNWKRIFRIHFICKMSEVSAFQFYHGGRPEPKVGCHDVLFVLVLFWFEMHVFKKLNFS